MKIRLLVALSTLVCAWTAVADEAPETGTQLVLLGTAGGPAVKKGRSQPANAVVVNGDIYIVDAGDGVSRQLLLAGFSVTKVRAVFITHNHSDHMADYGTLLYRSWATGRRELTQAFGPAPLKKITQDYLEYMRWDIENRPSNANRAPLRDLISVHEIDGDGLIYEDENVKVTVFPVSHGAGTPAYGYRFDTADKSIVFSGDTAPNENVINAARDVDILVHEVLNVGWVDALLGPVSPENEALRKHLLRNHTSTDEVAEIANKSGAKLLVLSHFAGTGDPVFDRPEVWEAAVRKNYSGPLVLGEDLMIID